MPTPTGMLKRGDKIRNKAMGAVCLVMERLGNDMLCSARLTREGGGQFLVTSGASADRKTMLMTKAGYWIKNGREVL